MPRMLSLVVVVKSDLCTTFAELITGTAPEGVFQTLRCFMLLGK